MKVYAYAGCKVDEKREGILSLVCDTETGSFERVGCVRGIIDPIYFVLNPAKTRLYAVQKDETGRLPAGHPGIVVAYAVEGPRLTELNRLPIGAMNPCHLAVDPRGSWLSWADYSDPQAGVLALRPDGSLDTAVPQSVVRHAGRGPNAARQECAHIHCTVPTPDGRALGVVDLGIDQIRFYDLGARRSGLREVSSLRITAAPGLGPRHILFHPNGRLMFLVCELGNAVCSYHYTGSSFELLDTQPMLPPGFTGASKAAAIKLTADGRTLVATNRGHESLAAYAVNLKSGKLTPRAISRLAGSSPRDAEFMPGDRFMLVGYELSDAIASYSFDRAAGTFAHAAGIPDLPVHHPLCFKFGQAFK